MFIYFKLGTKFNNLVTISIIGYYHVSSWGYIWYNNHMLFFQMYFVIMKGDENCKKNETNFKPLISNIKSKIF
jgi:hypothetical protein